MSEHPLKCARCGAEWTLRATLPMPLDDFVDELRKAIDKGCPECDASGPEDILLRMGREE